MTAIIREEPAPVGADQPAGYRRRCAGSSSAASPRTPRTASARRRTSRATSRTSAITSRRRRSRRRRTRPPRQRRRCAQGGGSGRGSLGAAVLAAAVGVAAFAGGKKAGSTTAAVVPRADLPARRDLSRRASRRTARRSSTPRPGRAGRSRSSSSRLESPEARPFGLAGADVLSISASGEMAVGLNRHFVGPFERAGTLARIGDHGRWDAPGDPGGRPVCRLVSGRRDARDRAHRRIQNPGRVSDRQDPLRNRRLDHQLARVSPSGDSVAFINHPSIGDDGGSVALDRPGREDDDAGERLLHGGRPRVVARRPRSVVHGGRGRRQSQPLRRDPVRQDATLLARVTGNLTLHDVARDGRVLVAHDTLRSGILGYAPGDESEKRSLVARLVRCARHRRRRLVVRVRRVGRGRRSRATRPTRGAWTARLRSGSARGSRCRSRRTVDGCWASRTFRRTRSSSMLPTGAGSPQPVAAGGLTVKTAEWLPNGKRDPHHRQ